MPWEDRVREYELNAQECERLAARTFGDIQQQFLNVAQQWRWLAETVQEEAQRGKLLKPP